MAVQLNMKKDLKKSTIGAAAVVYHFNQRFVGGFVYRKNNSDLADTDSKITFPLARKALKVNCHRFSAQLAYSPLYRLYRKFVREVLLFKKFVGLLRKTYLPIHVRLYTNPQGTHRSAGGFLVKSLYLFLFLSGYAWQSRTVKTQHFLFKRLTHAFAGNPLYFVSQRRTHRASIPESAFLSIFLPVFFLLPFLFFSVPVAHAATLGKPANNLGLTGYWSFNEGTSTQATDFSGRGNTGTLQSSPTWVNGKYANALSFSGSNWVDATDQNYFSPLVNDMTISVWAKIPTNASASGNGAVGSTGRNMLAKGASSQWEWTLENDSNTKFCFGSYTLPGSSHGSACVTRTMNDGQWHHYLITIDDGVEDNVYIDGTLEASITSFVSSMGNGTQQVQVGRRGDGNYFIGDVDEVRIYSRALTAAEVATLYGQGGVKVNSSQTAITNGLVSRWTFDGADVTDKVYDRVGNNNGYLFNAATSSTKVIGKLGQALNFDGVDDYVLATVSNGVTTNQATMTAWVKLYSKNSYDAILESRSSGLQSLLLSGAAGNPLTYAWDNAASEYNAATGLTLDPGEWYFVAAAIEPTQATVYRHSTDGTLLTHTVVKSHTARTLNGSWNMGRDPSAGSRLWNGHIDDVRIYSRTLSAAEIKQIYNEGLGTKTNASTQTLQGSGLASGLVGLWTFDGADLTDKVYDRSGAGNNGYIFNAATTSAKVIGKLGQALRFDDVNDYVSVADNNTLDPSTITVSAWVYPTGADPGNGFDRVVDKANSGSMSQAGYRLLGIAASDCGSTAWGAQWYSGSAQKTVCGPTTAAINRQWTHLVFTHDGTTGHMYSNGVLINSTTAAFSAGNSFDLAIGNSIQVSRPFGGSIDDVRIYNRALSAAEVLQLYNAGK